MNRRLIISCLVLLLVICVVLSLVSIFSAGFFIRRSFRTTETSAPIVAVETTEILQAVEPADSPTPTTQPEESIPPQEVPSPTTIPEESDTTIDPAIVAQMELIQRQVVQERGLEPGGEFIRVLFTPEQLRQRVLDDFLNDYTPEDAQKDTIVLAAFGLIEPDFDFHTFYVDLLSEQIAGFYDNETKEMAVVQGEEFGGPERLTYAHEYTHALQDEHYDIKDGLKYSDEACEEDSERCAAVQALLEGDASLSELNWFYTHATTQDRNDIFAFYDNYESPVLDSAPAFMAEDFVFPYDQGLTFVQYLYDHGGWDAVDQAYVDLPASTEQILHPERYPNDKPIPVALPDLSGILGTGWEEYDQNVMGEWYTYLILAYGRDANAQQPTDDSAQAAEGWGGDSYVVFYNPEDQSTVMVLTTLWESNAEAAEFAGIFKDYAQDRFGTPEKNQQNFSSWSDATGVNDFHIEGAQTTWILASDANTASAIWDALQE